MNKLEKKIAKRIEETGNLTIAEFMEACLTDEEYGYYKTKQAIGEKGDFVTSPEISQMFGELLAVWYLQTWQHAHIETPITLVELGPGRGTLSNDILRVISKYQPNTQLFLLETNPVLIQQQKELLSDYNNVQIEWISTLSELPKTPCCFVANEFFDALPTTQLVHTKDGWRERQITLTDGNFAFTHSDTETLNCSHVPQRNADDTSTYEYSKLSEDIIGEVAKHIHKHKGIALIIDYGYDEESTIDTLQALKAHKHHDPLKDLGNADLTTHVNFERLKQAASEQDIAAYGCITQQHLLTQLGIGIRTNMLMNKQPTQASELIAAAHRLVDEDAMGTLFKAIALVPSHISPPVGFSHVSY